MAIGTAILMDQMNRIVKKAGAQKEPRNVLIHVCRWEIFNESWLIVLHEFDTQL